ncbi:MAG TPA: helix-turn-helix transcriptional regulator [Solirubrobacteraceae bacterium]
MPARSDRADLTLGSVLRQLRLSEPRRSQEDVAFHAGLTAGALAKIELGRSSPEWRTVRNIAGALGVGLVELAQMVERAEAGN